MCGFNNSSKIFRAPAAQAFAFDVCRTNAVILD